MNFSDRLREYMEDANLSATELAVQLNCSRATVSGLLNAAHAPSTHIFIKLVTYFNCSADYILCLTDYPATDSFYPPKPFCERLRLCLKLAHKSEYRLQRELKISSSLTYRWLNGKAVPAVNSLICLAGSFGCSVDFLLGRQD